MLWIFFVTVLLLPTLGWAGQIQVVTATGRITGVRIAPAPPMEDVPGHTLLFCNGATCGGAATIADPITWPVPPQGNGSAGTWTTCAEGRPEFTVVSGNTLVVNPQITSTAGGQTLFYCQRVTGRSSAILAAKDPLITELVIDRLEEEDARIIAVWTLQAFRSCPTAGTHADCPATRAVAGRLARGDPLTIMQELSRLLQSKGY